MRSTTAPEPHFRILGLNRQPLVGFSVALHANRKVPRRRLFHCALAEPGLKQVGSSEPESAIDDRAKWSGYGHNLQRLRRGSSANGPHAAGSWDKLGDPS